MTTFDFYNKLLLVPAAALVLAACSGDPEVGEVDNAAIEAAAPDVGDVDPGEPTDPLGPPEPMEPEKTAADYPDLKIKTVTAGADDAVVLEKGQKAKVHYTGYLLDGTQFDSSHNRGATLDVDLARGGVIQGWLLGIVGMKVGETRRLRIPPELGYGARGQGAKIPPDATLMFDIELVEVVE